ncbi:hypothetical protein QEN35_18815 [Gordonia alkanivorans]|uniref:hypothetical protein n=1 Tax=Gordonia alkanivorans TaxID=84096 RepID=UPI00244D2277|nr:hypothetical protein [Gordonia alkanivorans]MDH3026411.1 hypothetical protein [Gordonia alkanivorans]
MAHDDVLLADSNDDEPPRPPQRLVFSATEGWVWVPEAAVEYWDDAHLWHDRPPR